MREYLIAFFVLLSGAVFASQELLQGELNITNFDTHVDLVDYRIYAGFSDYSLGGFVGTSIVTGNLVSVETGDGSVDFYAVTNVVSAGVNNVVLDVLYAQPGSSTLGVAATVAGLESLSTNSVGFPQQPSPEFCHLSQNHLNQIRNYAFTRIQSGGGSGTLTNEVDPVFTGWLDTNTYVKSNPGWLTNVVGYIPTDDASVTNARPWDSPNYNTITNPPAIPSTNDLASTNWVIAQGFLTDYTETDSIATNMISAASNHLELVKLNTNGNAIGLTNNVKWDTAATDASYATNWIATNIPGGSGSGFPLTNNANLAGFIMSNGSFIGNGSGLTNVSINTNASITMANGTTQSVDVLYITDTGGVRQAAMPMVDPPFDGYSYFRKDGYWSRDGGGLTNLPVFGITSDYAYRGDWGAAVSNVQAGVLLSTQALNTAVIALKTATNALNALKLSTAEKALATNSVQNGGAASVGSLRVTGAPTTNAMTSIWGCTNATTGEGNLNVLPKISAENTNNTTYPVAWNTMSFPILKNQVAGTWDGTNWTPGVVGYILIETRGTIAPATVMNVAIIKNNNYFDVSILSDSIHWFKTFMYYNPQSTNVYQVRMFPAVSVTNEINNRPMFFTGSVLP